MPYLLRGVDIYTISYNLSSKDSVYKATAVMNDLYNNKYSSNDYK
ncbi:MAG TPA: hypothetical protein VLL98_03220 [Rickettsiales bacterium]|nr:hypothetical protein [Rickettsiales bacterium]